jgi:hypothetical protein
MLRTMALAAVLLACAAPASAQRSDDMRGGGAHPCTGDAQSICSQFIPDRGKVASCLFKNKSRLSPACRAEIGGGKKSASKKGKGKGKAKKSKRKRR